MAYFLDHPVVVYVFKQRRNFSSLQTVRVCRFYMHVSDLFKGDVLSPVWRDQNFFSHLLFKQREMLSVLSKIVKKLPPDFKVKMHQIRIHRRSLRLAFSM